MYFFHIGYASQIVELLDDFGFSIFGLGEGKWVFVHRCYNAQFNIYLMLFEQVLNSN